MLGNVCMITARQNVNLEPILMAIVLAPHHVTLITIKYQTGVIGKMVHAQQKTKNLEYVRPLGVTVIVEMAQLLVTADTIHHKLLLPLPL